MNHHTAVLFNGQALCLIFYGVSTAVFNGALSASSKLCFNGALSARSRGIVKSAVFKWGLCLLNGSVCFLMGKLFV